MTVRLVVGADDFYAEQFSLSRGDVDPALFFGPLSCRLSDLFRDGFKLECLGKAFSCNYRKEKVHLARKSERYLVGKIERNDLLGSSDKKLLSDIIRDGQQMIRRGGGQNARPGRGDRPVRDSDEEIPSRPQGPPQGSRGQSDCTRASGGGALRR